MDLLDMDDIVVVVVVVVVAVAAAPRAHAQRPASAARLAWQRGVQVSSELLALGLLHPMARAPPTRTRAHARRAHDGYVVTNDMYRDHVNGQTDKRSRDIEKEWTRTRLISYTWVGDEVGADENLQGLTVPRKRDRNRRPYSFSFPVTSLGRNVK